MAQEGHDIESSYSITRLNGPILLKSPYKNVILNKWLGSLRTGNDYFKLIERNAYKKYSHFIQNVLLPKPSVWVNIAVLTEDYDVVLGFCVFEDEILHYVHTYVDNRRMGIASSLLPEKMKSFTHITRNGLKIWNNAKYKHLIFDPFQ